MSEICFPQISLDKIRSLSISLENYSYQTIFWYFLTKRYLKIETENNDLVIYQTILDCELNKNEKIAFKQNPINLWNISKNKKKINSDPKLSTTFYVLHILKYINKLGEYLQGYNNSRKARILNYLEKCEENLKKIEDISEYEVLYFILSIYHLLGVKPSSFRNRYLHKIKTPSKGRNNVFRYLCLNFFSIKDCVQEEDLFKLHRFQKPNGGFGINNSSEANIRDTFWIIYTLETFKWMLPYRAGPIYSYIINYLKRININNLKKTDKNITSVCYLVVISAIIYNTLINETEELIFSNMTPNGLLDLNVLSVQGGFQGAEKEIVDHINLNYKFQLEIMDNQILFRRFLNRINPFEEKVAIKLMAQIQSYSTVDLSEFRNDFNRRKSKTSRVKDDEIIYLIQRMMEQHFFTGRIIKKRKRLVAIKYIFVRDLFLERIIVSSKPVSWEEIKSEKRRLLDVSKDIFSMTREMDISSTNIMNEIESLIIVGIDPKFIEERLTFNIKKTLIDASFFNKTIESFQSEFQLVKSHYVLSTLIKNWKKIYSELQQNFRNVRRVLTIKIGSLKEEIDQHQLVLNLEKLINKETNMIIDSFDNFQYKFQNLESKYSREEIYKLNNCLDDIEHYINKSEQKIQSSSLKITSKEKNVSEFRKKVINNWLSQVNEFQSVISYFKLGFNLWNQKISEIDKEIEKYSTQLVETKENINQSIKSHDYNNAVNLNKKRFSELSDEISNYINILKKDISKYFKKNRKLSPLLRTIQREWVENQNILEEQIQSIRDYYSKTIETDIQSHLSESFKLNVEKIITELRQDLMKFEKQMNSEIRRSGEFPRSDYKLGIKTLSQTLDEKIIEIEALFKKSKEKYPAFEAKTILSNFGNFRQEFSNEISNLFEKYQGDELIHVIINYSKINQTNFINLSDIARVHKKNEKEINKKVSELISEGRINASLIGVPPQIEIHNEDWRNHLRLKDYNCITLRELESDYHKFQSLFEKLIKEKKLLNEIEQIRQLNSNLKKKIFQIVDTYEEFIKDHKINLTNKLLEESYRKFHQDLQKVSENMEGIINNCDRAEKFQDYVNEQYNLLDETINSEIHRLLNQIKERSGEKSYFENLTWLKTQKDVLNKGIEKIDENIEIFKSDNQLKTIYEITSNIEELYKSQKQELLNKYENNIEDLIEKLSNTETNQIKRFMDKNLLECQTILNDFVYKYDIDVVNKIRSKEFILSANKIAERNNIFENKIKIIEKRLKTLISKSSKSSKIFSVKYSNYYLNQWESYLIEFREIGLHSKKVALRTELVLHYTKFSIKSLKGKYVPINEYVANLKLKHETVKHILMTLISDDILSGKLDLSYDIYFEGSEKIDSETIASLDIIRKTSVKTYLRIQRLSNIFNVLGGPMTVVASLTTIILALYRVSNNLAVILSPIIFVAFIIIILWLKRGKSKIKESSEYLALKS